MITGHKLALVRAYVGVTDDRWYEFLRARPHLSEVNFWRPSGAGFQALRTGEPFLFKTHAPHDALVGGGFLSRAVKLSLSEAWGLFGEANGVASFEEMRAAIAKYRRHPLGPLEDPEIGCVLLRDVFFVPPHEALPRPSDFAKNLVSGKAYDFAAPNGSAVEAALGALLAESLGPQFVQGPTFGESRLVANRLGQQAFKALVLASYQRRCAITGERIKPVLQAAHIRPVSDGGVHRLDNGLLLRSDVHILFDNGYLGLDPAKRTLHVSPRLRSEFGNGEDFYALQGHHLRSEPDRKADRANREFLEWHMDSLFKSA